MWLSQASTTSRWYAWTDNESSTSWINSSTQSSSNSLVTHFRSRQKWMDLGRIKPMKESSITINFFVTIWYAHIVIQPEVYFYCSIARTFVKALQANRHWQNIDLQFNTNFCFRIQCIRSYVAWNTRSLQHSEVKLLSALSVLRRGTTREPEVMYTFLAIRVDDIFEQSWIHHHPWHVNPQIVMVERMFCERWKKMATARKRHPLWWFGIFRSRVCLLNS